MAEKVLPDHVLELVVDRLNLPDLYRFGWVCKSWKSVCDPMQFQNYLPWLIVPFHHNPNPPFEDEPFYSFEDYKHPHNTKMAFQEDDMIGFFSLTDNKTYKVEIPELLNRRICGSCPGGWLITVHENSQIQLFNPLTSSSKGRVIHHLPPLTEFPLMHKTIEKKENEDAPTYLYYIGTKWDADFHKSLGRDENFCDDAKHVRDGYIYKVAMSSSRVASGTILMAIQDRGKSLAFYRIGSHQHIWTSVSLYVKHCNLTDLTFFRGEFYAVNCNGYVLRVHGLPQVDDDEQGEQERPVISVERTIDNPPVRHASQYYIVESSDDLLVVLRYLGNANGSKRADRRYPYKTVAFRVFKLEFAKPNNNWIQIESLGDRSLFLGYNSSFSVLSNDFFSCKPNCIYFTDDNRWRFSKRNFGGHDMGIFHLEDGSIDTFLYPSGTHYVMPPPIWFSPYPSN
ncbi:hypothetical protein AQUCO_02000107v1 [Aquilegia coerulea]|uniref:F-box domain-containing protein n=1 Tax=Aquilegia coerulea TaxID=218851 RepID=A0A2G5DFX4_AQUCA|nr:hypothetical protein AQUCO_02000107v1 [Aquilegia coerulea]